MAEKRKKNSWMFGKFFLIIFLCSLIFIGGFFAGKVWYDKPLPFIADVNQSISWQCGVHPINSTGNAFVTNDIPSSLIGKDWYDCDVKIVDIPK